MKYSAASVLVCLNIFALTVGAAERPLVKIDSRTAKPYVGELISMNEFATTIFDLRLNAEVTVPKSDTIRITNPISVEDAAKSVGVAQVAVWKIIRLALPVSDEEGADPPDEKPDDQWRIAVCPFPLETGELTNVAAELREQITTLLVNQQMSVVERSAIASALGELRNQNADLFDGKTAQQVGRLTGASHVVLGRIVRADKNGTAFVRLVDVGTGNIVTAVSGPVSLASARVIGWESETTSINSSAAPAGGPQPLAPGFRSFGSRAGEAHTFSEPLRLKMVWCPPGSYVMGSNRSDPDAGRDEMPAVEVTLSQGFWIGESEITQSQWRSIMNSEPWKKQSQVKEGPDFAASYISWNDAQAFCQTLTDKERRNGHLPDHWAYRLPSEAEWEFACRAMTRSIFFFGNDSRRLSDYGWWGALHGGGNAQREPFAHIVRTKKPNPWNLYDMPGNVWEWCLDTYVESLPGGRNPLTFSDGGLKSMRGGSWGFAPNFCRSAMRNKDYADARSSRTGLRVVLSESLP